MLTLYGSGFDTASAVQWYLEEIAVPYQLETVTIDQENKTHRTAEFLALNPVGKVPVITDGPFKLTESGAIFYYLAEKHQQLPESPEDRAVIMQWMLFASNELVPALFFASQRHEAPHLLGVLNDRLKGRTFVVGDSLTIADIATVATLAFAFLIPDLDLSPYAEILRYRDEHVKRPALQKVLGDKLPS